MTTNTYYIVSKTSAESLQEQVNELLSDGWSLYGDMKVIVHRGQLAFHQPMTHAETPTEIFNRNKVDGKPRPERTVREGSDHPLPMSTVAKKEPDSNKSIVEESEDDAASEVPAEAESPAETPAEGESNSESESNIESESTEAETDAEDGGSISEGM